MGLVICWHWMPEHGGRHMETLGWCQCMGRCWWQPTGQLYLWPGVQRYVSGGPEEKLFMEYVRIHLLMSSFLALVGPSDVGGTCPIKSYVYTWERTEYCCCGGNCCWLRCTWPEPPASCLPPGAAWHYNTKRGFYIVSATKETTTSVSFAPEGYVLKWEDDFNGVEINTTNWVIARSAAK